MGRRFVLTKAQKKVLDSQDKRGLNVTDTYTKIIRNLETCLNYLTQLAPYLDKFDPEYSVPYHRLHNLFSEEKLEPIVDGLLQVPKHPMFDARKMKIAKLLIKVGADYVRAITYQRGFEDIEPKIDDILRRIGQIAIVIEQSAERDRLVKVINEKYRRNLSPTIKLPDITHYQAFCVECHRIGRGKTDSTAKADVKHAEWCHFEQKIRDAPYMEKVYYHVLKPEDDTKYVPHTRMNGY